MKFFNILSLCAAAAAAPLNTNSATDAVSNTVSGATNNAKIANAIAQVNEALANVKGVAPLQTRGDGTLLDADIDADVVVLKRDGLANTKDVTVQGKDIASNNDVDVLERAVVDIDAQIKIVVGQLKDACGQKDVNIVEIDAKIKLVVKLLDLLCAKLDALVKVGGGQAQGVLVNVDVDAVVKVLNVLSVKLNAMIKLGGGNGQVADVDIDINAIVKVLDLLCLKLDINVDVDVTIGSGNGQVAVVDVDINAIVNVLTRLSVKLDADVKVQVGGVINADVKADVKVNPQNAGGCQSGC